VLHIRRGVLGKSTSEDTEKAGATKIGSTVPT